MHYTTLPYSSLSNHTLSPTFHPISPSPPSLSLHPSSPLPSPPMATRPYSTLPNLLLPSLYSHLILSSPSFTLSWHLLPPLPYPLPYSALPCPPLLYPLISPPLPYHTIPYLHSPTLPTRSSHLFLTSFLYLPFPISPPISSPPITSPPITSTSLPSPTCPYSTPYPTLPSSTLRYPTLFYPSATLHHLRIPPLQCTSFLFCPLLATIPLPYSTLHPHTILYPLLSHPPSLIFSPPYRNIHSHLVPSTLSLPFPVHPFPTLSCPLSPPLT